MSLNTKKVILILQTISQLIIQSQPVIQGVSSRLIVFFDNEKETFKIV